MNELAYAELTGTLSMTATSVTTISGLTVVFDAPPSGQIVGEVHIPVWATVGGFSVPVSPLLIIADGSNNSLRLSQVTEVTAGAFLHPFTFRYHLDDLSGSTELRVRYAVQASTRIDVLASAFSVPCRTFHQIRAVE